MDVWEFREYVGADGEAPVSDWLQDLSLKDLAKAERFLRKAVQLERLEPPDFKPFGAGLEPPDFKPFGAGLEARWFGLNKVPRRLSCYRSGSQVTFLGGFIHKNQIYTPRDANEISHRRRREIKERSAKTRALDY